MDLVLRVEMSAEWLPILLGSGTSRILISNPRASTC